MSIQFESFNKNSGVVIYSKECLFLRRVYREVNISELRSCWLQFLTDRERMTRRQADMAEFYHSIHELLNETLVK